MNASLVYETGVAQRKHESEVCGLVFAITKTPVWGGQTRFANELRQSGGVRLVLPLLHFTVRLQGGRPRAPTPRVTVARCPVFASCRPRKNSQTACSQVVVTLEESNLASRDLGV